MSKKKQGRSICPGLVEGQALVTRQGVSFLGGVDHETGVVTEVDHELHGQSLAGKVLILPALKGSAGGMWIIIRLARAGLGPRAIVVDRADTILVGAVIMGEIPTIDSLEAEVLDLVKTGDRVRVDGAMGTLELLN